MTYLGRSALGAAFIASGAPAFAATTGPDFLSFQGTDQSLAAETITSPSGGTVTVPAGTYRVNTSTYDGLAGFDTLLMTNFGDVLDERSGQQVENVERFIAGDGDDVLLLDEPTDVTFLGGPGNDILMSIGTAPTNDTFFGSDGNDFIDGGAGDDWIQGNADNDTLLGGAGNDTVSGNDGDDTAYLGAGDDTYELTADVGDLWHDEVHVGSGFDTFFFGDGGAPIDFGGVSEQVLTGSMLKTTFRLLGYSTTSLFEDLSDPTGTLDLFRFSDGTTVTRNDLLGEVPPIGSVPLPAGGLLLLSGLALIWRRGRT